MGAELQKLCKWCIINVLNHKRFHYTVKIMAIYEFETAIVHLKLKNTKVCIK